MIHILVEYVYIINHLVSCKPQSISHFSPSLTIPQSCMMNIWCSWLSLSLTTCLDGYHLSLDKVIKQVNVRLPSDVPAVWHSIYIIVYPLECVALPCLLRTHSRLLTSLALTRCLIFLQICCIYLIIVYFYKLNKILFYFIVIWIL